MKKNRTPLASHFSDFRPLAGRSFGEYHTTDSAQAQPPFLTIEQRRAALDVAMAEAMAEADQIGDIDAWVDLFLEWLELSEQVASHD